ncbi:carbonic anhydrase/acetyltransferase-like protein (isoleucine patch superfamily) [Microbacteriaceae bacterium SG_E_30_P1]|uniref:Carbonic anhydrase/acetyltransferase-like protein (Isoleucine patch superfamily) n=1 Tax=Antiquaquibacter oligotrophicus TaxID=2880260 RepID=A0ABT6KNK2_9MICO|nr:gamma carbonic anhydrase family protein [Antiquaquibacter oligotrophicus]MDH6181444.1 carbonic anhydrase/acetyltransferase-like protein (isoleucine patch superfamily) [Antiquaquibacter oligotrophicus]UDF12865.1 gamma carbonic anhydrase family protein [Antiquaquibacter oligotrophicus]
MALLVPLNGSAPSIASSAWVAPNATLVGAVTLGERASVFYGSVLRADSDRISVGRDSNLQDNVTVHCDAGVPTIVGAGVSVGHGAILHGCTIEDDCLIGMGATVLNGAVIGSGSLVAAGAVVLEGTIVPPGSLVAGVPGKVRRELTDDEKAGIRTNAAHYLELSAAHARA